MCDLRSHCLQSGHKVTSRWLDVDLSAPYTPVGMQQGVEVDLQDIEDCEVFIAYNPVIMQKKGTGGRHVEFGYALARNKPIIYIGEKPENVYHYAGGIYPIWTACAKMSIICERILPILEEMRVAKLRQGTRSI